VNKTNSDPLASNYSSNKSWVTTIPVLDQIDPQPSLKTHCVPRGDPSAHKTKWLL